MILDVNLGGNKKPLLVIFGHVTWGWNPTLYPGAKSSPGSGWFLATYRLFVTVG